MGPNAHVDGGGAVFLLSQSPCQVGVRFPEPLPAWAWVALPRATEITL
jgi:hypothetical protein